MIQIILLPILTLVIGWGLNEFGKFRAEKRFDQKLDEKKYNKLLFNLLELRWFVKIELDMNQQISVYIERYKEKVSFLIGQEAAQSADLIGTFISDKVIAKFIDPGRIKEIEANLNSTIAELAEIYPLFAYELSGRFNVKERFDTLNQYFDEVSTAYGEIPKEVTKWIQPKLSSDLVIELEKYILRISEKIDTKTKTEVQEKLKLNNINNYEEMDKLIEELINQIPKLMETEEVSEKQNIAVIR